MNIFRIGMWILQAHPYIIISFADPRCVNNHDLRLMALITFIRSFILFVRQCII